jgi:phenylacetate-coenzyme A ligase PaaK-like adenylate-forming protein
VADLVRDAIRNELNFRPEVTLVPPGTLPRPEMKAQRVVRKM